MYPNAITITFGDQAENHVGMQQIVENGFTIGELKEAANKFTKLKYQCEFINLNELLSDEKNVDDAVILIVRNGTSAILKKDANLVYAEQAMLNADKKTFMYGKVINKHAHHNLCFDEKDQESDHKNRMRRILSWDKVPLTKKIRDCLPDFFGKKAKDLTCGGNYYYDIKKYGVGFNRGSERKRVISIGLGADIHLHYQWFKKHIAIGERGIFSLQNGDIYAMSEKATGFDYKKNSIYTLRHVTGGKKFTTVKNKRP